MSFFFDVSDGEEWRVYLSRRLAIIEKMINEDR